MFGSHKRAYDAVPGIEGRLASTEPEPTHIDSVITSTETPIDDEKTPVQRKLANTDNSNCGDLELTKYNRVPFFCFKALFFFCNNVVVHVL